MPGTLNIKRWRMRPRRKCQRALGQQSSAVPFSGPSSACKAALEALADVYRTELRPFGVDFVVIQPGLRTQSSILEAIEGSLERGEAFTVECLLLRSQPLARSLDGGRRFRGCLGSHVPCGGRGTGY